MIARNALVLIVSAAVAGPALADQTSEVSASVAPRTLAAPARAFEIGLGLGYSQGVGDIGSGSPTLTDLSHGGGEVQLSAGYRIDPNWLVGIYGSGGKYSTGNATPDGSDIWSATAGVQANYHFLPTEQWDPWVSLGTGWRGHWVSRAGGTDSRHGLDLARLQVGLDYRVSREFAIAPYVGATATLFLTESLAQQNSFSNIQDPNVNFFFVGGISGRFDFLGG
jgi:hypothetical protein